MGEKLRALLPSVWSAEEAYNALLQYANNQRKKMLDKKDGRPAKYAATYLRILFHLCELLERRTFTLRIADTPIGETLRRIKANNYRAGEVIDLGDDLTQEAARRLVACSHSRDLRMVDASGGRLLPLDRRSGIKISRGSDRQEKRSDPDKRSADGETLQPPPISPAVSTTKNSPFM